MDGGVGGPGDEAVGVEERAYAAESNANDHRRRDAGPAGQRLPTARAAAHQRGLAPAGHLPARDRTRTMETAESYLVDFVSRLRPGTRCGLSGAVTTGFALFKVGSVATKWSSGLLAIWKFSIFF